MRNLCLLLALGAIFAGCSPRTTGGPEAREDQTDDPRGAFPSSWYMMPAGDMGNIVNLVGQPMPPLQLSELRDGQLGPDELDGKVLILDFWATWCGPCIDAIPHNNELYRQFRDSGAVILGICTSEGQDQMAAVADEHGVIYPLAKDPGDATSMAYEVPFFPMYIAVDRSGTIRAVGLRPEKLGDVIQELLEETPVATVPAPKT